MKLNSNVWPTKCVVFDSFRKIVLFTQKSSFCFTSRFVIIVVAVFHDILLFTQPNTIHVNCFYLKMKKKTFGCHSATSQVIFFVFRLFSAFAFVCSFGRAFLHVHFAKRTYASFFFSLLLVHCFSSRWNAIGTFTVSCLAN